VDVVYIMENRHKIVKFILRCSGIFFIYNIGAIVKKEMVLEQARIIREYFV